MLVFGTFMTLLCKPMFVALSSVYTLAGATACLYFYFFGKLMDRWGVESVQPSNQTRISLSV